MNQWDEQGGVEITAAIVSGEQNGDSSRSMPAGGEGDDDKPSLDMVYHLVREQFVAQQSYKSALDSKAGFILGSASLLTSVLAVWQIPHHSTSSLLIQTLGSWVVNVEGVLPVIAIVVYLAVVLTAYGAYFPFSYKQVPDPVLLKAEFLRQPEAETKEVVLDTTLDAFVANRRRLAVKAVLVRLAFIALLLEALVVGALLIVGSLG